MMSRTIVGVGAVVIVMLAVEACDDRPRTWKSFVYPNAANMDYVISTDGFQDFESCQMSAVDTLHDMGAASGDFACGYRCGLQAGSGVEVCKEKRK